MLVTAESRNMGDRNQLAFISRHRARFSGPVLEVGSRDYGSTQPLRGLFPSEVYLGVDLQPGPGVDQALDLTRPFAEIEQELDGRRFGAIFCLSVLEHCAQPFLMADNLSRLLTPGGAIYVSVPFAWKFHGYPSDYWRFTHEGVKKLFPALRFDGQAACLSTSRNGEVTALNEEIGKIPLSGGAHRAAGHWLRGLSADLLRLSTRLGLLRWLAGYRYVLAPSMINMIGELPRE